MGFSEGAKLYKPMKEVLQEMTLTKKDSEFMPIWLWSVKCRGKHFIIKTDQKFIFTKKKISQKKIFTKKIFTKKVIFGQN